MNYKISANTLLFLVAAAVSLFYLSADWRSWRPATCLPDDCFCEEIRPGAIAQPANTWSSLSFVLVGLSVLFSAPRRRFANFNTTRSNLAIENRAAAQLYAAALFVIGLGSAFYHASLSFVGQFFDVLGMYLLITFVILLNFSRLNKLPRPGFAAWFIILNAVLAYFLIVFPEVRRHIFGGLVIATLSLEFLARPKKIPAQNHYLLLAVAAFGLGFLVWILDITKILCAPTSWLQGHALWHVMGAVAAGLLFLHYKRAFACHSGGILSAKQISQ